MAGKQVVSDARRRNANVMAAHLRAWAKSGLSQVAYCQRIGVSLRKFEYWRRKLGTRATKGVKFVELVPSKPSHESIGLPAELERESTSSLRVTVCGGRFVVDVPDGFTRETLVRIVAALECS
jgi:hypothetical protein